MIRSSYCCAYTRLLLRLSEAEYYRRFSHSPNLVIQEPGRFSALHDGWDPTQADMINLASTIHHSDVIVNIASTIAIDAAVSNKPVVSVAFGGEVSRGVANSSVICSSTATTASLWILRDCEWFIRSTNFGRVRMYLKDPTVDASGRRQLQERLCYNLDGQAGRRASLVY